MTLYLDHNYALLVLSQHNFGTFTSILGGFLLTSVNVLEQRFVPCNCA